MHAWVSGDTGSTAAPCVRGNRDRGASGLGGLPSDIKRHKGREVPNDEEHGVEWFGKSRRVVSGFTWDSRGEETNQVRRWVSDKNTEGAGGGGGGAEGQGGGSDSCGLFAGTQSMGPVYRRRPGVEYVPLDAMEDVYSAAQRDEEYPI